MARFVGLDSDEQTNRRILKDAVARLRTARRRAAQAARDRRDLEARLFLLADKEVLAAIGKGVSDTKELKRFVSWPLDDEVIQPLVAEIAEEFSRARAALAGRVPTGCLPPTSAGSRFAGTHQIYPKSAWTWYGNLSLTSPRAGQRTGTTLCKRSPG